jgi:hypothetical protein
MEGALLLVLLLQAAGFVWALKCLLDRQVEAQATLVTKLQDQALLTQDTLVSQARIVQDQIIKSAAEENTRLVLLADSAMDHIKSKSVEEKVKVEAQRKAYDMRLEMLRDTMAKETAMAKDKQKKTQPEPQWVQDADGNRVDANQVEWMD